MDKLILFLLIIVLILCFKNVNVMVKKSDEDVIKVIIVLIIVGLIFMCKDDLVEGNENADNVNCDHPSCVEPTLCWTGAGCGADGPGKCKTPNHYCGDSNESDDNKPDDKPDDKKPDDKKPDDKKPDDKKPDDGDKPGGDSGGDSGGSDIEQGLDFLSGKKRSGVANGICYQTYYPKSNGDPCQGDITGNNNWKNQTDIDLKTLNTAGVTTLKLYDWDLNKGCGSHKLFLDDLSDKGMQVIVPISQYFMGKDEGNSLYASDEDWGGKHNKSIYIAKASGAIDNLLNELIVNGSYHPAVYAIGFGNEPDLQSDGDWYENFTNIIKIYLNKEKERITNTNSTLPYIVVPLSYGGNTGSALTGGAESLQKKIRGVTNSNFIDNRFVIGINIFSSANAIEFSNKYKENFMITEFYSGCDMNNGMCREIGGGAANAQQFNSALSYINDKNIPNLKGIFAFLYQPQTMQAGSEKNFGLTKYKDSKYESVGNCVSNNNCPPQGSEVCDRGGRFNALAEFYGGTNILSDCSM